MSMPAPNVISDPPATDCTDAEMSGLDTAATTVNPSLAGSLSSVDNWDDGRTASWIHDQSSFDMPPLSDSPPPSSVSASPAPDDPTTAVDLLPTSPSPPQPSLACSDPHLVSNAEGLFTSRIGRVIRPVRQLIESMVQLESVLGVEPNSNAIIHV